MIDFTRALRVAVPSAAIGFAIIFGLMAAGFDAVFAHACSWGLSFVVGLALAGRAKPAANDITSPDRPLLISGCAIGYALSLWALLKLDQSVNPYIAQIIAACVFFCALLLFAQAAAYAYRELSTLPTKLVSRPRNKGLMSVLAAIVAFARNPRIGRVLLAVIMLLVAVDLRAFVRFYRTVDERAAVPVYARVESWIDQATCFKRTGVIFVVCRSDLVPAEDASVGDDRGHGLLLSVLHRWFDVPVTKQSLVFINAAFTVFAVLLLAWQFVRLHRAVAAIIFLGLTLQLVYSSGFDADVHRTNSGLRNWRR